MPAPRSRPTHPIDAGPRTLGWFALTTNLRMLTCQWSFVMSGRTTCRREPSRRVASTTEAAPLHGPVEADADEDEHLVDRLGDDPHHDVADGENEPTGTSFGTSSARTRHLLASGLVLSTSESRRGIGGHRPTRSSLCGCGVGTLPSWLRTT